MFAVDDVRNAFPSVRIANAVADYRRHIGSNEVLWLIEDRLAPAPKARRIPWGSTRAPQVGPGTLNLRLHYALDLPQIANQRCRRRPGRSALVQVGR